MHSGVTWEAFSKYTDPEILFQMPRRHGNRFKARPVRSQGCEPGSGWKRNDGNPSEVSGRTGSKGVPTPTDFRDSSEQLGKVDLLPIMQMRNLVLRLYDLLKVTQTRDRASA